MTGGLELTITHKKIEKKGQLKQVWQNLDNY